MKNKRVLLIGMMIIVGLVLLEVALGHVELRGDAQVWLGFTKIFLPFLVIIVGAIYVYLRDKKKRLEEIVEEEAHLKSLSALPMLIPCPICKKEISKAAAACPSCGHPISLQAIETLRRSWSPGIAAVLSLFIPGAGQIYKGHVGAGILWLVLVVGGYFLFIIPGIILHLVCIFNAARDSK